MAGKRKLVLGISTRDDMEWNRLVGLNGIAQNVKFFYDLLDLMGHEPYLIGGNTHPDMTMAINGRDYRACSVQEAFDHKIPFDVVFEIGVSIGQAHREQYRALAGGKIVCVRYGHAMYMDMEQICYGETMTPGIHIGEPDMVWASPHFASTYGYLEVLYSAPVRMAPYIREPDFVGRPFTNADYKDLPSIYVMEPNFSILKNALIPMAIIEQLARSNRQCFHEANVQNGMKYFKHQFFLNSILPNFHCFKGEAKTGFFNPRCRFDEAFATRDVLLGYQHECELNYLYMEALYKGVPLVHNSPAYQEVGYYYPENDVYAGRDKCLEAIADKDVEGQLKKNAAVLHRYSIHNTEVQASYDRLLEEVLDL